MIVHAFPLTPLREERVDEAAFSRILERLDASGVAGICVLGSTGIAPYLSRRERHQVVSIAAAATSKPITAGISALRTADAIAHAHDAEAAGATALLLAPMSYVPLHAHEVVKLFRDVASETSLPIVCYDNPGTTRFTFDLDTYRAVSEIPNVTAIKTPAATDPARVVQRLREALPAKVTLGTSGDATAPAHLQAGFDAWYSVIAGLFPDIALALAESPKSVAAFAPLWQANAEHGSLRVLAMLAEMLEYAAPNCLPLPLTPLDTAARRALEPVLPLLRAPHAESGDGWVTAPDGRRYWGKYGAAGLLVFDPSRDAVLLQHRAPWSHEGDTWSIPGGARDSNETAYEAALREAHEEASVPASLLDRIHDHTLDLGFWRYDTFTVATREPFEPAANDTESSALEWVPVDAVASLRLHPGFASSWPQLRSAIAAHRSGKPRTV